MYKIGDVLKPTDSITGYCQIYKVSDIPSRRLGLYSSDNSVTKLYHVYTDFGNTVVFIEKEISDHYEVVCNEDVYERMLRWRENVLRMVDEWEVLCEGS